MDQFSIICALVGGALGGVLGYFIGLKIKHPKFKMVPLIVLAISLSQLGIFVSHHPSFREFFMPPTKLEVLSREMMKGIQKNVAATQQIAQLSRPEAELYIQQKTRLGLKRLSYDELREWNHLRIKMAEANAEVCASFWTGKMAPQQMMNVLEKLSDAELQSFIKISLAAVKLELDQAPFETPSPLDLEEKIQDIAQKMSKEDAQRLQIILSQGQNLSTDDACWAMKVFLKGAFILPARDQERFLRALASL